MNLLTHSLHPLFDSLPTETQQSLQEHVHPMQLQPGELLFAANTPATLFAIIHTGHVRIELPYQDQKVVIQTIGPGEAIGWSWMEPPYQWQFSAQAVDAVSGIWFDADWLRRQCEKDRILHMAVLHLLLQTVSERLTATRLRLLDCYK